MLVAEVQPAMVTPSPTRKGKGVPEVLMVLASALSPADYASSNASGVAAMPDGACFILYES